MPTLVLFLLLFIAVGIGFLVTNLLIGRLVRPSVPEPEKATIYECGEPTIGSSWIQFDLRFYVVALLFVIFDVEMAFFFPWAVVFGSANQAADASIPVEQRTAATAQLIAGATTPADPEEMSRFAWFVFLELVVFFAVLLVGFAYLWRRGDLDWIRSTAAQSEVVAASESNS